MVKSEALTCIKTELEQALTDLVGLGYVLDGTNNIEDIVTFRVVTKSTLQEDDVSTCSSANATLVTTAAFVKMTRYYTDEKQYMYSHSTLRHPPISNPSFRFVPDTLGCKTYIETMPEYVGAKFSTLGIEYVPGTPMHSVLTEFTLTESILRAAAYVSMAYMVELIQQSLEDTEPDVHVMSVNEFITAIQAGIVKVTEDLGRL